MYCHASVPPTCHGTAALQDDWLCPGCSKGQALPGRALQTACDHFLWGEGKTLSVSGWEGIRGAPQLYSILQGMAACTGQRPCMHAALGRPLS